MEVHLVSESIKFMILGMGIVFVFLYVLVQMMRLQAYIIGRYFPEAQQPEAATPTSGESEAEEKARVAAIVAAIREYRKTNVKGG